MYSWNGSQANTTERELAVKLADKLGGSREKVNVVEGEEPEAFWTALGGKGEYPTVKVLPEASREPMLFQCSNSSGTFEIEPIFDFAQSDLEDDDVYILDTFTTVFIWLGSQANELEKKRASESAEAFVEAQGYSKDTPIVTVKAGDEKPIFTCYFLGWSTEKTSFVDPYQAKLAEIAASNPPAEKPSWAKGSLVQEAVVTEAPPAPAKEVAAPVSAKVDGTYNYDDLKKPTDQLPAGVDPMKREQYLSDAEFESVLGSPRAEFNAMKGWKQQQIKKAKGLF
jgi:hypothetical protein